MAGSWSRQTQEGPSETFLHLGFLQPALRSAGAGRLPAARGVPRFQLRIWTFCYQLGRALVKF